jgi:hypothetical protein
MTRWDDAEEWNKQSNRHIYSPEASDTGTTPRQRKFRWGVAAVGFIVACIVIGFL